MKKIYRKYLIKILGLRIPEELTGFEKFKVKIAAADKERSNLVPAEEIYCKKIDDKLWLFLSIIPNGTQEQIWLEVGWSSKGRFPWNIGRPTVWDINKERSEFMLDECMLIYGSIYRLVKTPDSPAHAGWDVWDCSVDTSDPRFLERFILEDSLPVSEELAELRVHSAIDIFLKDVKSFVLPYLEERVQFYIKEGK